MNISYQRTPLHSACYRGYTEIARVLINAGADVNAVDEQIRLFTNSWAFTPLLCALQDDFVDIAQLLIEAGADLNAKNQ